jgi:predicted ATPase
MTEADFQAIREQITAFDDIQWIDDAAREIVEKFMPDLAGRLPAKRTDL